MEGDGNKRQRLGQEGEDIACRFLMDKGHTIIERNWRAGHLEIDIISVSADGIHFVEVKTRRENIQAPPQENVNHTKQRRIIKAAGCFLRRSKGKKFGISDCQFDIIAATKGGTNLVEQTLVMLACFLVVVLTNLEGRAVGSEATMQCR